MIHMYLQNCRYMWTMEYCQQQHADTCQSEQAPEKRTYAHCSLLFVNNYLLVILSSGFTGSALLAGAGRVRPKPKPAPRPTSSAMIPVITAGMTGELLCVVVAGGAAG